MRIARCAEPRLIIEAGRFNNQCVVSLPMTNRVSIPGRIWIFGKGSAIGPDRAPRVFALEELNNPVGNLNKLKGRRKKHNARETRRVALQNGVIAVRYRSDRKSTRLNSSHRCISYAVFC